MSTAAGADGVMASTHPAEDTKPACTRIAEILPRLSGQGLAYLVGVADGLAMSGSDDDDPRRATA